MDYTPGTDTLTDRFAALVRAAIESGQIPPDARLTQQYLVDAYAVGRTPVRIALERLRSEGLVVATGPRTLLVRPVSRRRLDEVFQVRIALEQLAMRIAVEHVTVPLLGRLRAALKQIASLTRENLSDVDIEELLLANRDFHQATDTAVTNQYLRDAIERIRAETRRLSGPYLRALYKRPGRAERELGEHRGILRALEERDDESAARLIGNHLSRSARELRELIPETNRHVRLGAVQGPDVPVSDRARRRGKSLPVPTVRTGDGH